jgi:Beta protein
MSPAHQYLPILKSKRGEFRALRTLSPDVRSVILPMMELLPPRPNKEGRTRHLREHVHSQVKRIGSAWGCARRILVDVRHLPVDGDSYPLADFSDCARRLHVHAIPVASTTSSASAILRPAGRAHRLDRLGVCLRERPEEIARSSFETNLAETLYEVGVQPAEIDFVIDVGEIPDGRQPIIASTVAAAIARLPHLDHWRTLTVAASAVPATLSHLAQGPNTIPRGEWLLYCDVCSSLPSTARIPGFGDYATVHPALPKPRRKGAPTIRYTGNDEWLYMRGRPLNRDEREQYFRLAQALVANSLYRGRPFSPADEFIHDCAIGSVPAGDATTWVGVAVNHHVTFVVRQLASRASQRPG